MQNSNIKAKSRFTKSFYFLSTVFVDNFVENEEIKPITPDRGVYDGPGTPLRSDKICITNQWLAIRPGASQKPLPIISAAEKIVHKSG
jgi:hypothetical protein